MDASSGRPTAFHAVWVYVIWLGMTGAGLWLVSSQGLTVPYADDWAWVDVAAEAQPVTLGWLWAQHNEHRVPLPKLLWLAIGKLTGHYSGAVLYFDIVLLSLTSLGMIWGLRVFRGRIRWTDAVFPLALMHWGPYSNLIWGFQIAFVLTGCLTTIVLLSVIRCGKRLPCGAALGATVCLLGAAACGANGVVFLPPMACWLLSAAVLGRGDGPGATRAERLGLVALAGVLSASAALYFMGFQRPGHHASAPGLFAALWTQMECLAGSLGHAGREIWPLSGALVLGSCGLLLGRLAWISWRQPEERIRGLGLAAWLAALLLLTAGIGWGRSFCGPGAGFADRYMTLTAPLWCLFYLAAELYASPRWSRRLQTALLAVLCVSALVGFRKGSRWAAEMAAPQRRLEQDAMAGLPPAALAVRHGYHFGYGSEELFADRLEMLRMAGVSPYRNRATVPIEPVVVRRMFEILDNVDGTGAVVVLRGGERFVQRFAVAGPGALYRIDMELSRCRSEAPDHLQWILRRAAPAGPADWASGTIDTSQLRHDVFALLTFPPLVIDGELELELELFSPPTGGDRVLPFRIYDRVGSEAGERAMKGFVFLARNQEIGDRFNVNVSADRH